MSEASGKLTQAESPTELNLCEQRWQSVIQLAAELTRRDVLPSLALCVVRKGRMLGPLSFGGRRLAENSPPLAPGDRFVVASLTKPIVAMAVLRLSERGLLSLNDRVSEFLPEYNDASKRLTTLRHLLTHTSGLPDSLPTNFALRKAHAPLSEFVSGACDISLDFPPGRGVQYQSLGYALLGEIIARVSGQACGDYLREAVFVPIGMSNTTLAQPIDSANTSFPERLAEIRVPREMEGGDDWNWNSDYWRSMGAPWGGLISTAADLARYCEMMLRNGLTENGYVFSPASIQAATRNQLNAFHDVPEADRRTRPWGFGWRLNWPAHPASFGDLLSERAYGHWGATGTLFWIDPERDMAVVLLSTQPLERDRSPLVRLSNMIAASVIA